MNYLLDLGCGLLFVFIAFVLYDWGRIWWHARRHGYISIDLNQYQRPAARWEREYLGYKVWTVVVAVAAWLVAIWHLTMAALWFSDLVFAVATS